MTGGTGGRGGGAAAAGDGGTGGETGGRATAGGTARGGSATRGGAERLQPADCRRLFLDDRFERVQERPRPARGDPGRDRKYKRNADRDQTE
jgi:hypothetical protein